MEQQEGKDFIPILTLKLGYRFVHMVCKRTF